MPSPEAAHPAESRRGALRFRLFSPSLEYIDLDRTDALVCTHHEEDRPLQGFAGLLDWRLHGALNQRVKDGLVSGKLDDTLLYPVSGRKTLRQVILIGGGPRSNFSRERFEAWLDRLIRVCKGLSLDRVGLEAPLFPQSILDERVAAHTLISALNRVEALREVDLVAPDQYHATIRSSAGALSNPCETGV
ncbi:MAG: hypothetical protein GMKNLPBB_00135 [Myxococcota bacterium]|nr:hypothetical protein [Myxococcota bacterium]